ncbi:MAG: rod shape-determining protein RodA [Candidatus Margulisiibacteriota bacterium]
MINFRMLRVSDKSLFISVFLLMLVGFVLITSSTYFSELKAGRDAIFYLKRQFGAGLLGLGLMGLASYFDYKHLKALAVWLYPIMLFLLAAGHLFGVTTQGAQRWLSLGPISFQPSEIAKLIMIIVLASYFDINKEKSGIMAPILLMIVPFVLVFKQPDLGTALVIAALAFGMLMWNKNSPVLLTMIVTPFISIMLSQNLFLWAAYLFFLWLCLYFSRVKLFDILIIMGLNVFAGIAFPIIWGMLKNYQQMRLLTFLNPGLDPHGMGYHTLQSKIAIGAGGIFGAGLFHGTQTQLQFIPIQHSDFIFSAIGEELGFIGSIIVLGLFINIIWRALVLADESRDYFGSMLAAGIAVFIGFHTFVNIGMTLGLLPVVGIPLPFVSYGGTSLVINMTAIGILQSIAMRRQKLIF